jgi:glucose-1-phosphate thymidylyltransferase
VPKLPDITGLIPAAGSARRLGHIAQSKEILPVAFGTEAANDAPMVKPACHHVLQGLKTAGITRALMVIRTGKWDIPATLAKNPVPDMDLAFVVIDQSAGVPWTLDRAYRFLSGLDVVMGFPDVLIRPPTLFRQMVEVLRSDRPDVVLGLMPTNTPQKVDVVEISDSGRVLSIVPKPAGIKAARAWVAAAWRPSFTEYMHQYLIDHPVEHHGMPELYLGDILAASLAELDISVVVCDEGQFVDIGTPEDLAWVKTTG